ncbi:MAG: hypothetical protein ACRDF7_04705 [Candidatus Limnocylindrales bacterium]
MRRFVGASLAALLALSVCGCGDGAIVVRGIVVEVQQPSFTHVTGFTLRTADGRLLTFVIGDIPPGNGSFPPIHLRDHLASALPIDVRYVVEHDQNIALRLADAPPP